MFHMKQFALTILSFKVPQSDYLDLQSLALHWRRIYNISMACDREKDVEHKHQGREEEGRDQYDQFDAKASFIAKLRKTPL